MQDFAPPEPIKYVEMFVPHCPAKNVHVGQNMVSMQAQNIFKAGYDVFLEFLTSPGLQDRVPIVMLLYEGRMRVRPVLEQHQHSWDPILGQFQ